MAKLSDGIPQDENTTGMTPGPMKEVDKTKNPHELVDSEILKRMGAEEDSEVVDKELYKKMGASEPVS